MVQELVISYMNQRRSIILAVISADNPFANQPVTKFARQIDPTGTRTLGLITKPDKIERGSDSERYYGTHIILIITLLLYLVPVELFGYFIIK